MLKKVKSEQIKAKYLQGSKKVTSTPTKEEEDSNVPWDLSRISTDPGGQIQNLSTKSSTVETKASSNFSSDIQLDMNKLRFVKIIDKLSEEIHQQKMKEYKNQIEILKDRINNNRHCLEATNRSIEALRLTKERNDLAELKNKILSNTLDGVNIEIWEQNLEALNDEIQYGRSKLELKKFDSKTSFNIDILKKVTNETLKSVKTLKTKKVEGSSEEVMKNYIKRFNAELKEFKLNDKRCKKLLTQLEGLTLHEASLRTSLKDGQSDNLE